MAACPRVGVVSRRTAAALFGQVAAGRLVTVTAGRGRRWCADMAARAAPARPRRKHGRRPRRVTLIT